MAGDDIAASDGRDTLAVTRGSQPEAMNDTPIHQLQIIPVVECPWCQGWTEVADDAATIRCDACGIETELAPGERISLPAAA
jgi:hypothetical protein